MAALLAPAAEEAFARYGSPAEVGSLAEQHSQVLSKKPDWKEFPATKPLVALLNHVEAPPAEAASKTKLIMLGNPEIFDACLTALQVQDGPEQWILAFFYEILREDSSCYAIFEGALKRTNIYQVLMKILSRPGLEQYTADKAAWLLSAVICHVPGCFTQDQVIALIKATVGESSTPCSQLGELDIITNLLKSNDFRRTVFAQPGVSAKILEVEPTAASPIVYKAIFAIWMLSFDTKIASNELKKAKVVKVIRDMLVASRAEKVIRLSLTAIKNLLNVEGLCEDIVEENVLDVVSCLEFEKWRDAELYDEIRDMIALIGQQVATFSNIDRYEREVSSGKLNWGHMHTNKFWVDNAMLFERNEFSAITALANLILDTKSDPTTIAVACHDLGEFVSLHPLGKKIIARLNVKKRVMELMGDTNSNHREVRREALLCCQKMTLNRWQDVSAASDAKK